MAVQHVYNAQHPLIRCDGPVIIINHSHPPLDQIALLTPQHLAEVIKRVSVDIAVYQQVENQNVGSEFWKRIACQALESAQSAHASAVEVLAQKKKTGCTIL